MTMKVTRIGTNEDGSPHYLYESDGHVIFTGPVEGPVTTADGTTYDVSAKWIEVQCADPKNPDTANHDGCHANEVMHLIGLRHNQDGHPTVPNFHYDAPEYGSIPKPVTADADALPRVDDVSPATTVQTQEG